LFLLTHTKNERNSILLPKNRIRFSPETKPRKTMSNNITSNYLDSNSNVTTINSTATVASVVADLERIQQDPVTTTGNNNDPLLSPGLTGVVVLAALLLLLGGGILYGYYGRRRRRRTRAFTDNSINNENRTVQEEEEEDNAKDGTRRESYTEHSGNDGNAEKT